MTLQKEYVDDALIIQNVSYERFNLDLVAQGLNNRDKMLKVCIDLLQQKYVDCIERAYIEREFFPNEYGIVFFVFRVCLESGAEYMQGSRNLLKG